MFSKITKLKLARAAAFKNVPTYVQFYITARCNLRCEQCNIIYANSDCREVTIEEIKHIADNLAEIGVAIVLLTGGEPFIRKDIHEIIYAFESRGIHVRMQTNGFASEKMIERAVEAGGKDISISLDSLVSTKQDKINGGYSESWLKALETISYFTKYLPKKNSFASLGCVMQPNNINDIENVIKFGSSIGWYTSLVPAHVTDYLVPRGFRTFDNNLIFKESEYSLVKQTIHRVREMRRAGYLLYDSDQYLNDILRFIMNKPIKWRERNKGNCDSPNLYFALLPNGEFAPCCDHRLEMSYPAYSKDFPKIFKSKLFRKEVFEVTSKCEGCMYGSYPEITISMRYNSAKIKRIGTFLTSPPSKPWPLTKDELQQKAEDILNNKKISNNNFYELIR